MIPRHGLFAIPYLYMPNATGDVDFSGAYTIPADLTADSYDRGDWTFNGTFETIEWTTAPIGTYGFSAQDIDDIYQGEFVKVGDYVRIIPMRCYLEYIGSDSQWAGVRGKNRVAAREHQGTPSAASPPARPWSLATEGTQERPEQNFSVHRL